jgi:hypothetical protein
MIRNGLIKNAYKEFCLAEGNQNIASEYAIEKINVLVETFRLNKILEVGLGIGSISGILLSVNKNNLDYSGTEDNGFCLNALSQNLKEYYCQLKIFPNLTNISFDKKFDLIIVDGKDQNLQLINGLISKNGIIVIEGDRMLQQEFLLQRFPNHKYVHSISLSKNEKYSPFPVNSWQGGLKIIFVNPTRKQTWWCLKEKLLTKIKYQYPGRHLGSEIVKKIMRTG